MHEAAGIVRIGITLGVHGVVVVLGVGRIDGDQRQLAPVLAPASAAGAAASASASAARRKDMRDAVRVDGDHAHGALALERAQPLVHPRRRQAETALACGHLDRDQLAVLRVGASRPAGSRARGRAASCRPARGARRRPGSARKMPSTRCLARSTILMTRPAWRIASCSSPVPRRAAARGRRRRRSRPAAPCAARRPGSSAAVRAPPRPTRPEPRSARRRGRAR